MKKLVVLSVLTFSLFACVDELEDGNVVGKTMTVSFEEAVSIGKPDTRAQFNAGLQTVWNKGDLVSVFYRQNVLEKWLYTGAEGASSGSIERAEVKYGNDLTQTVVVYPYSLDYTLEVSDNTVSAVLPSTQSYKENSFGEGGNVMIAYSSDNSFTMKSVVGWLRLRLLGDGTVGEILLSGNDSANDVLSGQVKINYETLAMTFVSGSSAGITLDCGSGVALSSESKDFYIALPPHVFASGLTVVVKDTQGEVLTTKSTNNPVEIKRRSISSLGQVVVGQMPAVSSVANLAAENEEGVITLAGYWADSKLNGKITSATYELFEEGVWKAPVSSGSMTIKDDHVEVRIEGLTPGAMHWPIIQLSTSGITGEKIDLYSPVYAGQIIVPAISSVANTAGADEDGVINLVATWDSALNGKITKVTYELRNDDWSLVEINGEVAVGEMTVSTDKAEVKFEGLVPGSGPYWPVLVPYIGETSGEQFHLSDGGLYAGQSTATPVPAISRMENTAGATENGVINLVAYWDNSLNGKITKVTYELYMDPWELERSGEMEVHSDHAVVRFEGLEPGSGAYWPVLVPYIGETSGEQFYLSSGEGLYAGEAINPAIARVANLAGSEEDGVITLAGYWDDSRLNGKITSANYKMFEEGYWTTPVASGAMTILNDHVEVRITGLTPAGMFWPKIQLSTSDVTGEEIDPHTALYAGKKPAPAIPELSEIWSESATSGLGGIYIGTAWDSSIYNVDRVKYSIYNLDWSLADEGDLTISYDGWADATVYGLTPGAEYFVEVLPYNGSTAGPIKAFVEAGTTDAIKVAASGTAISSFNVFNVQATGNNSIYIAAGWESGWTGKISGVAYQVWTSDWKTKVTEGYLTLKDGGSWAEGSVNGLSAGTSYIVGGWPYVGSTQGAWAEMTVTTSGTASSGGGSTTGAGKRKFPMHHLNITQGRFNSFSHTNLNAYDLAGSDGGIDNFVSTGTYEVVGIYPLSTTGFGNTILFYDVDNDVTLALTHMNSISSAYYIGRMFYPGDVMYCEGTAGKATGNHIHMEIGRGYQTSKPYMVVGGTGNYQLQYKINIEDYFYIDSSITVVNSMGYNFERW